MSEFECKNGHLMKSGEYICTLCGSGIGREDGISSSEARKREEMEDLEDPEEEEEEPEEEIDNS